MTLAEKETVLSLRQQQYSFSAIAESTGLPLGTIKSFLSRASGKKNVPASAPVSIPTITMDPAHCRQCGAVLERSEHRRARSFCNDRCRTLFWNAHRDLSRRASTHQQVCEGCGRTFYTYHGRYCSRVCYGKARSQRAGAIRG